MGYIGGTKMSYQLVRRLMLDQPWIHDNFYVKPLQFPSDDGMRTFYFTAQSKLGSHFGILGELMQTTIEPTKVFESVHTFFNEAISEHTVDVQIFEALCKKLDASFNGISISFQMWSRHKDTPYVSVISMGMHMLRFVTKDYREVKLPNTTNAYESRKNVKYVRDEVRLHETQFMILATNSFTQPTFLNNPDSIFELSRQLNDYFTYKVNKNPSDWKEACVLLIDFNKFDQTHEFILFSYENFDFEIEEILKVMPPYHDQFAAKLILSELLMNAFKQGYSHDPVKVIVGVNDIEMYIEVFDMTIHSETRSNKSPADYQYMLDEYDRGLFLVNTFSNDVYINNNSITSRIKRKSV